MTTRLVLICHAATSATRRAAFPLDEPIEAPPPAYAGRADLTLSAPATSCRQTAGALGLTPMIDERLRDCDYGHWAGRTLGDLASADPAAVHEWLTDATSAPHGGESTMDLLDRAAGWLDDLPRDHRRIVAVTHPSVIKAAVVHAILATPRSYWRIDVPPLSRTVLSGHPAKWTLRSLAAT
ncbi:histidine phosphatase family protein [Actinophytocola sp.]|uniref:histidine phosphatase family protein n=1 Tax=Actinophytocola sp. TaxID=1872138 RepID=UPI002EDA4BD2